MRSPLVSVAVRVLRVVIPLALVGWLVSGVDRDQWRAFQLGPAGWGWMATAFVLEGVGISLTFVRWWLLVGGAGLSFTLANAFRLGSLGYLFSFLSVGAVGGDLLKAVFIAREQPGRRPEAVATVVFDRVLGLYSLMLVASCGLLFGGLTVEFPGANLVRQAAVAATAAGGVGLFLLMVPGVSRRLDILTETTMRLPSTAARLVDAARLFARQRRLLVVSAALGAVAHALTAVAVFVIGRALFTDVPSPADHLVIVPLAMAAGAVPLTPGGFGAFELAMGGLYALAGAESTAPVSGVLIALGYRLVTLGLAAAGLFYYWTFRGYARAVIDEARSEVET